MGKLFWTAGFLTEAVLLYLSLTRSFSVSRFFLWHALACAFFGLALLDSFRRVEERRRRPEFLLGFLMTFFFSCFGLAAWGLFIFFMRAMKQPDIDPDEMLEVVGAAIRAEDRQPQILSWNNILRSIRREVNFEPFTDILKGGTFQSKIRAIEKLSRGFSPDHVALLREALKDASADIRLYAASALMKIETEMTRRIEQAKQTAEERGTEADFAELGERLEQYADLGMLDSVLSRFYREEAAKAYRQSLDLKTGQPAIMLRYAKILLKLDQYEKALNLLERALKLWPDDAPMILLTAEAHFYLGHFEAIPGLLGRLSEKPLNEEERKAVLFWSHANGSPTH